MEILGYLALAIVGYFCGYMHGKEDLWREKKEALSSTTTSKDVTKSS